MYSMVKDWRNKRNMMLDPTHYSVENYYTDVNQKKEMKHSFGEDLLNNLHLLPDPLKKNLADSIITSEEPKQKPNKNFLNMETVETRFVEAEKVAREPEQPPMAPFSGISSFFSGVMNVISGAMFHLRPRSPPKYYDCFDDTNVSHQGSPPSWQASRAEDQNKNEQAHNLISNVQTELKTDMNKDCRSAAAQCEDKLNKVRLLLTTKPVETPKYRSRRPRKVFVEPGSVEESFQDAFSPEDFISLSNESFIEYYSPYQVHQEELLETDSPRMRTGIAPVHETTNIVETLPVVENNIKNCIAVKSDNLNCESVKNDCKSVKNDCKSVKTEINCNTVDNSNSNVDKKHSTNMKENESVDKKLEDENINKTDVPNIRASDIPVNDVKEELVSSCEDKLLKLKALLQERRKNNSKTIPQSSDSAPELPDKTNDKVQKPTKMVQIEKSQDKRFKNPCRRTDKRKKMKLKKHIHDDMVFAHEINSEDLSSVECSPSIRSLDKQLSKSPRNTDSLPDTPVGTPKFSVTPPSLPTDAEYFDEVSGRFRSTSTTESEDSFQIVFNDSPKTRTRLPSDCDSEDSFIVFEDSPDSCYTSNDVFGDESEDDSEYSDSDSDVSDSGCVPINKLAHNLSRTIGDLTDTSLYDDQCVDEVDCAVRTVCEEISSDDIVDISDGVSAETKDTGLLLTEAKKRMRKDQPAKKVQFSSRPPEVRVMRVWTFAARQARKGHWERYALDRDRFKRRIADVDMAVSWVLKPQHRSRVMFQRFMPWWNAQKRKEIAEKKQKKEEEERRMAEEKIAEERRLAEEREAEELRLSEEKLKKESQELEQRLRIEELKKKCTFKSGVKKTVGSKKTGKFGAKIATTNDSNKNIKMENKTISNGYHDFNKNVKVNDVDVVHNIADDKNNLVSNICNKIEKKSVENENKEPKHVETYNNEISNTNHKNIDAEIVSTNDVVILNGNVSNDTYKHSLGIENVLNGQIKDITLDLKKETVSTT